MMAHPEHKQCRSTAQLQENIGKMKGVFERFKTEHKQVLDQIPEKSTDKERAMALEIKQLKAELGKKERLIQQLRNKR